MPNNKVDQAPRIKNNGEKKLKNSKNGFAMRPHDLETIFFNLIPYKNIVQLKVMLYLTGNAEGFRLIKDATLERLNVSSSAYYNARKDLVDKGWISVEEGKDFSYIVINYNKIYEDGKSFLNKEESNCETTSVEEGNSQNTSVGESNCENTPVNKEKEGICETTSEESNCENISVEGICETTPLQKNEESICEATPEGYSEKYSEGYSDNYYNRIREENKKNKIMSAAQEEFLKDWGQQPQGNVYLTGPAANF